MIEPPDDAVRQLIAAESTAPVTNAAAQAAVRAKLGATLGIAIVASSGSAAAGGGAAGAGAAAAGGAAVKTALTLKLIGVVLGVGAVTGGVVATYGPSRSERAPATVQRGNRAKPPVRGSAATTLVVTPIEAAPIEDTSSEPVQPAPTPSRAESREGVVPGSNAPAKTARDAKPASTTRDAKPARTQRELLAGASRALSLGDPARALQLLDEDARVHETGPLIEDREALRVSTLLALGRGADAREVARHLLATFPHTIHRALAERALTEEDTP